MRPRNIFAAATVALLAFGLGVSPAAAGPITGGATYDATVIDNQSYGSAAAQVVTLTKTSNTGRTPLVIFIHGGGWTGGSRTLWNPEALAWAHRGWTAVSMDYRKAVANGTTGDGILLEHDVSAVLAKYRTAGYVDPTRVVLVGDSAGGHLALLSAYQDDYGDVAGVIGWSAVASVNSLAAGSDLGVKGREFWPDGATGSALDEANAGRRVDTLLTTFTQDYVPWSAGGAGPLCSTIAARCTRHVWSYATAGHGYDTPHTTPEGQDMVAYARSWAAGVVQ